MRRCNFIRFATVLLLIQSFPPATTLEAKEPVSDKALYMRHVNTLTSEEMGGRKPITPGAKKARAYLTKTLRDIGLKPAFGNEYIQPVLMNVGTKADIQQLQSLGPDKKPVTLKGGDDFNALAISTNKAFSGQAVFVGYAITSRYEGYDDFAGITKNDLKGKVAVAFRYEPHDKKGRSLWADDGERWTQNASITAKAALASWSGASALVIVNPPACRDAPLLKIKPAAFNLFFQSRLLPVMHVSTAAFKRMLAGASLDADKEITRLTALTKSGKGSVSKIPGMKLSGKVSLKTLRDKTYNIAARIPGRGDLANEAIIVGAHWDHLGRIKGTKSRFPGADDNASGVAGVLILARRLAANAAKSTAKHRRTIILTLFGAEELALLGSAHMAANLKELGLKKDSQVAAMVNMDMIGRLRANRVYAWGVKLGGDWERLVRASGKNAKLTLDVTGMGFGPSDHASFNRRKIPVVSFTTGIHPDMHRTSDTPDKINSDGAVRILNIVERLIESLIQ